MYTLFFVLNIKNTQIIKCNIEKLERLWTTLDQFGPLQPKNLVLQNQNHGLKGSLVWMWHCCIWGLARYDPAAFMKPFWSPKTERIQLVVLCLLLSPPPPTRVAAPVSEQTNKEQRAPPAKQGGDGQLELLHSILLHLARSSLQLQLKLCSPSLCALPHF